MKTGPTGHYLYLFYLVEQSRSGRAKSLLNLFGINRASKCCFKRLRLFEYFLNHVVIKIAHIGSFQPLFKARYWPLNLSAICAVYLHAGRSDADQVSFFQINKTICYLAQRHCVRRQKVFAYAHTYHQRTAFSRAHNRVRGLGIYRR